MLKQIINRLGDLLLKPFKEHLLFLIAFFVFATSNYFIIFIEYREYYYALHVLCHCILISYLTTLVVALIQNDKIRKIIQIVVIILSAFLFGINSYCVFQIGTLLDADYTMLMLDTNVNEAKEFISFLVPLYFVLWLAAIYALFIIFWVRSKKHTIRLGHKWSLVAMGFICFCTIKNIPGWGIWVDGPIGKITELYKSLKNYDIPDESEINLVHPTITFIDNQQIPLNVVLIIGESFARNHSSLYGYKQITNPCLSEIKNSSLLYTFDSIDSPASTTALALKYTLSTYNKDDNSVGTKWYEYPSIIELMQACDFDCYWFSNQAKNGQHNNIGRFYSSKCKQYWFLTQKDNPAYDKVLLPAYDQILVDSSYIFIQSLPKDSHNFIIYHMLGSHFEYDKRYPEEFSKFKDNDYLSCPQNQRSCLSSYDNSILYNDYVIEQIINLYKDSETLIIYLPDHGHDVYCSSRDYCGHGKINNPISYSVGVEIPFMIYASSLYQEKHPETMQRIKYRQDHPKAWNSDDLPYLIMDLIGVKEVNGEDVKLKSVLD